MLKMLIHVSDNRRVADGETQTQLVDAKCGLLSNVYTRKTNDPDYDKFGINLQKLKCLL